MAPTHPAPRERQAGRPASVGISGQQLHAGRWLSPKCDLSVPLSVWREVLRAGRPPRATSIGMGRGRTGHAPEGQGLATAVKTPWRSQLLGAGVSLWSPGGWGLRAP